MVLGEIKKQRKILVTSAHLGSAVATIRALGSAGHKVVAADSNPKSLGFRSRFVHEAIVYPSPDIDAQQFVDFLLDFLRKNKIDLLIPVTDSEILPIRAFRKSFDQIVRLAMPGNDLLEIVNDKIRTIQLAKKVGVPVPKTYIARDSEEALHFAEKMNWPIVVKPQFSKKLSEQGRIEPFHISYANSRADLQRLMHELDKKCKVILQVYNSGVGYGIEMLTHNGMPIAAFAHKRLREIPVTGGASSYRQSIEINKDLFNYALRLLREIRWTGVAMVEFKVDGNKALLMEINGRIWGSLPLAVASGVNFPLLLVNLFLNNESEILSCFSNDYEVGLRCRNLVQDLMWIVAVFSQHKNYSFLPFPKRGNAIKALLGYLNPLNKYDILCLNDPVPGLLEFPVAMKKIAQKVRTREVSGLY